MSETVFGGGQVKCEDDHDDDHEEEEEEEDCGQEGIATELRRRTWPDYLIRAE
jgi:hypothetical protein